MAGGENWILEVVLGYVCSMLKNDNSTTFHYSTGWIHSHSLLIQPWRDMWIVFSLGLWKHCHKYLQTFLFVRASCSTGWPHIHSVAQAVLECLQTFKKRFFYSFIFIFSWLVFGFEMGISLCSAGCLGTHYEDQAKFKLTEIYPPLPPMCWD